MMGRPCTGTPSTRGRSASRSGCYVLLTVDPERPKSDAGYCRVEFVRVAYDVEEAARAVEESPLPDAFADLLRTAY